MQQMRRSDLLRRPRPASSSSGKGLAEVPGIPHHPGLWLGGETGCEAWDMLSWAILVLPLRVTLGFGAPSGVDPSCGTADLPMQRPVDVTCRFVCASACVYAHACACVCVCLSQAVLREIQEVQEVIVITRLQDRQRLP